MKFIIKSTNKDLFKSKVKDIAIQNQLSVDIEELIFDDYPEDDSRIVAYIPEAFKRDLSSIQIASLNSFI